MIFVSPGYSPPPYVSMIMYVYVDGGYVMTYVWECKVCVFGLHFFFLTSISSSRPADYV